MAASSRALMPQPALCQPRPIVAWIALTCRSTSWPQAAKTAMVVKPRFAPTCGIKRAKARVHATSAAASATRGGRPARCTSTAPKGPPALASVAECPLCQRGRSRRQSPCSHRVRAERALLSRVAQVRGLHVTDTAPSRQASHRTALLAPVLRVVERDRLEPLALLALTLTAAAFAAATLATATLAVMLATVEHEQAPRGRPRALDVALDGRQGALAADEERDAAQKGCVECTHTTQTPTSRYQLEGGSSRALCTVSGSRVQDMPRVMPLCVCKFRRGACGIPRKGEPQLVPQHSSARVAGELYRVEARGCRWQQVFSPLIEGDAKALLLAAVPRKSSKAHGGSADRSRAEVKQLAALLGGHAPHLRPEPQHLLRIAPVTVVLGRALPVVHVDVTDAAQHELELGGRAAAPQGGPQLPVHKDIEAAADGI
eukprot:scaffold19769_cov63-Phaeocystis_antarctica.AAC.10